MPATIRKGSTGADVLRWQGLLNAAGFVAPHSGTFDDATETATRAWQGAKGLAADGVVGPASWEAMVGAAPDPDAEYCRAALIEAWPIVTGAPATLPELQIAAANAKLESSCGKASYKNKVTGESSGVINNWGAVQAGPPPCDPAKAFEATDTRADGTPYQWCFARYATPGAGAAEMVRQMTVRRPTSWEAMKRGDIDAWAKAMREKDPVTGVGLYFEQSVEGRAKGIEQRVRAIAAAFGEPVVATRGGPPSAAGTVPVAGAAALSGGLMLFGVGIGGLIAAEILSPGILVASLSRLRKLAR